MPKQQMAYHKAADFFPMMNATTFNKTLEDIKTRGFENQIVYVKNKDSGQDEIIDGRNRERAATALKIDIHRAKTISGQPLLRKSHSTDYLDILGEIRSLNLMRRDLTASQRAAAAAEIMGEIKVEMKERQAAHGGTAPGRSSSLPKAAKKKARDVASAVAGAKPRLTHTAAQVMKEDPTPDKSFFKKVKNAEMTAGAALREIKRLEKTAVLEKKAAEIKETPPDHKVVLGDCIGEMEKVEAGSVNLVVADPPYNIGVDYGDGDKRDKLDHQEYQNWTREWTKHAYRVLNADGSIFVVINSENADHMGMALSAAGFARRSWIAWYETFGVNCSKNFNRCHRHIFYCVKNPKKFIFNESAVKTASARLKLYHDKRADLGGKIWDDVWVIPRLVDNAKERVPGAPNQLPLAVVQTIVEVASDPGDMVLDPFCGSGTSVVAAIIATGGPRRAVGIDRSEKQVALAEKRVKATMVDAKKGKKSKKDAA